MKITTMTKNKEKTLMENETPTADDRPILVVDVNGTLVGNRFAEDPVATVLAVRRYVRELIVWTGDESEVPDAIREVASSIRLKGNAMAIAGDLSGRVLYVDDDEILGRTLARAIELIGRAEMTFVPAKFIDDLPEML